MASFFKGRIFAACYTPPEFFLQKLKENFTLWPNCSGQVIGFLGKEAFVKGGRALADAKTLIIFDVPSALLSFTGLRFLDSKPQAHEILNENLSGALHPYWPLALCAKKKMLKNAPVNLIEITLETNKTDEFVGSYLEYIYSVPGKDSYERRALRVGFLRVVFGEWSPTKLRELWASLSKAQKISKFRNASSKISAFLDGDRGAVYLNAMRRIVAGADIDEAAAEAGFAPYDFRYFLSIKKKGETL